MKMIALLALSRWFKMRVFLLKHLLPTVAQLFPGVWVAHKNFVSTWVPQMKLNSVVEEYETELLSTINQFNTHTHTHTTFYMRKDDETLPPAVSWFQK